MLAPMSGSLRTRRPRPAWRRARAALTGALMRLASPRCAVCDVQDGDPVCDGCLRDFFDPDCTRCAVCAARLVRSLAAPAGAQVRCGRCLAAPPRFDRTVALGDYQPPLDGMVMALKSGGRIDLARVFGQLLARRAAAIGPADGIVAVPLAPRRLRERGFNQSMQIASTVAAVLQVPVLRHALARERAGPPQQSLPLSQRRRNVRGAFAASPLPASCRLAVVDDVLTSGATLDEVAGTLKRAGAAQVVNLVVARTP
jgi:ComF family protein